MAELFLFLLLKIDIKIVDVIILLIDIKIFDNIVKLIKILRYEKGDY